MWNKPTGKQLAKLPEFYTTEETPAEEKTIKMHFFIGGSDWYVAEYDGDDTFFGFVILNSDYQMAEWGYFSLFELDRAKDRTGIEIDIDLYWQLVKFSEIVTIKKHILQTV